jgi:hypothetical protein
MTRHLRAFSYPLSLPSKSHSLTLSPSPYERPSYQGMQKFVFLNLTHNFEKEINWNFSDYGKLWTYNLNYFDYLNQSEMTKEQGLYLIKNFIAAIDSIKDGMEPYPISLRCVNWIKFLTRHDIRDRQIDNSLYAQSQILLDNLEYHLLGNHLLENAFSLLFVACYFRNEKIYNKATNIMKNELKEQILDDGAHFELSPMYHQIMLYRLLDCLNLMKNNQMPSGWEDGLMGMLKDKSTLMLKWLSAISYADGNIPLFNDSANNIAPTTMQLNEYASMLDFPHSDIKTSNFKLGACGYRKITKPHYECVIDVGGIGPDYIPGHAHADTFSFELYINKKPFIVDTGISTYNKCARRDIERGTASHNTVEVEGRNSSEVWGSFRVANRARIVKLNERNNVIEATHDGYKKMGISHQRTWRFEDDRIVINDNLNKKCRAVARLHFHPDVTEEIIQKHITINRGVSIEQREHAPEFNKTLCGRAIVAHFEKNLETVITL